MARFSSSQGSSQPQNLKPQDTLTVQGATPKVTIGDAGAEDTMLVFDGNAVDFHVSLDDNVDDLVIGTGQTAGSATLISINGDGSETKFNQPKITLGDATAEDTYLIFDGNAQDYRIGIDDGTDTLEIGHGAAHGTNTAIAVDSSGQVTKLSLAAAAVAVADDHIVILDGGATGAPKAESIQDLLSAIAGSGISVSGNQLVADGGGEADAVAADNISAGDAAVGVTTSSGNITVDSNAGSVSVDGHTGLTLTSSSSGEVDITSAANVDINATTGIAVDGTTLSIDGTDDSNLTVTASGKDLDIAVAGGGTQELRLASAGTGASAMHLNASAGGINVDSADMIDIDAADEITIDTTSADGHIAITSAHTAGQSILISANANAGSILDIDAGIMDVDVQAAVTIDAVGIALGAGSGELDLTTTGLLDINANALDMDLTDSSSITITSSEAAEDLTISQAGANDSSIIITAAGTGADAISIDATAGSIVIGASLADNKTLTLGNTSSTHLTLTPDDTPADEKILLYNATGTADDAIKIHSDAGGVTITADNDSLILDANGTDADALNIDSAGGIDVDAAGAISLDSSAGSIDINVVDGQTVNIGLNGGVEQIIAPHGTAGSELYSVINTAGTTDGSAAAGSILLSAVAGGIGLAWADGKDLWAEGGRAVITANEDAADCIKLHADAGTSQTITVLNDAGTGAAAIGLTSSAGGITLTSSATTAQDAVTITASQTTKNALTITADAVTTASAIDITADALTSGEALKVVSNCASTTARSIAHIHQDHASATHAVALRLTQDAVAPALQVEGPIITDANTTQDNDANGHTITAAQLIDGTFFAIGRGSSKTDTTATAAEIVAAIPNAAVGSMFMFRYVNLSGNPVIVGGGTTVTMMNGSAASFSIGVGQARVFAFSVANVGSESEAVSMIPMSAVIPLNA